MDDENGMAMDQVSAHLDRAWDLLQRGEWRAALLSAQQGLEIDAESADAHYLIGYIHAQEGSPDDALEHYEQALALDDTFFEAMLNAAEVMIHSTGNLEEAYRLLEEALDYAESPEEEADVLLLRVDALLSEGRMEEARRAVLGLPKGPFENPHLEFMVARARFEVGETEGVEDRLRKTLAAEPHHADAHYYLGLALDRRQDHHGATVAFLQTRELDLQQPKVPWAVTTDLFERKVQAVIQKLPATHRAPLDGALVVVVDVPGAEVVADGVDPRATVLLDGLVAADEPPRVGRVFVYQRNVERAAGSVHTIEEELARGFERELGAAYPAAFGGGPSGGGSSESGGGDAPPPSSNH